MTFTLLGRCPHTGRVGIGIATYSLAVGMWSRGVRGNVGVTMTQANIRPGNNNIALDLLARGYSPQYVMNELAANDPHFDRYQIGVIDRTSELAVHTGPKCGPWAGHKVGPGYIAFGNVLAGPEVVEAIAAGYEKDPDADFEIKLLNALEGGRDAGGQAGGGKHLTERSAALIIASVHDYPDLELRVDVHDSAIHELRRIYEYYQPYRTYYTDRARNPHTALPQYKFAEQLEAEQAKKKA